MPDVTVLEQGEHRARWLPTGAAALAAMVAAIGAARRSVRLEFYIIRAAGPAADILAALLAARRRGVRVWLLHDALGCEDLPPDYFAALRAAGGEVRVFSPRRQLRLALRNHRKLLVVDERQAIVGGINIGSEYAGDGITSGWRDLALWVEGPVAAELAAGFDAMYVLAPLTARALRAFHRRVARGRRRSADAGRAAPVRLLQSGLGWPRAELRQALHSDLGNARAVHCSSGYFLPSARIRDALAQCVARGGHVQLLLSGPTDVPVSKYAGEHLYRRLLRSGVSLFEYQPQVLHAKLLIIDDIVYVGSCNLDRRSLLINYELLLRLEWPELAGQARAMVAADIGRSRLIEAATWRRSRWERLRSFLAYWLLTRVDPWLAQRRVRDLD